MTSSTTPYKIIIGALTLMLIAISIHSYGHKKVVDHFEGHIEKYPLLDPALPFYEKKDLVVNVEELRNYFKTLPEQNKDWAEVSIYFETLNTGVNVSVNQDLRLFPASLAKLPIAMIAMKKVEKGEWNLDNTKLVLIPEDVDVKRVDVQSEIGKEFSIRFLLERLLVDSDNTAYHMLVRELSEQELLSIAEAVGLEKLFEEDAKVSAKDYTRLFRALHSSTYLNEDNSQLMLSLLDQSKFGKFLRAGVPQGVHVASKWGINEVQNAYADAGIIFLKNRPYMISVIIHGVGKDQVENQQKAEQLIKDISSKAYEFMLKQ
jgi:beta-lactamase class A